MKGPKGSSVGVVAVAAALLGAAWGVRMLFPAGAFADSSELAALKAERTQLEGFTDASVRESEERFGQVRRELWTREAFEGWRQANVPKGWVVQDLGPLELKEIRGRRYAFQRPGATDGEWPEVAAVLGALERAPATSVRSVALAVEPGYAGSRRFTQCLLIAVFYFAGDVPGAGAN